MIELPKMTFQMLLWTRSLLWTLSCLYGDGIMIAKYCSSDLGMESGKIKDEQLSASSSFDWKVVGPQNSRIRHDREGGAWCPANPVTRNSRDWLEIDLIHLHKITGVEVQGRFGGGQGQEFVEWFTLEYKRKNATFWIKIDQVFTGNSNTYVAEKRNFGRPVVASMIRFLPVANHTRTVCLRVEVYGCQWLSGLLYYNLPQGHSINLNKNQSSVNVNSLDSYNLTDAVYDGQITSGILKKGIGYLVDGASSGSYQSLNEGWLGWKGEELNQDEIWVEFVFDGLRCFNHVDVFFLDEALKQAGVFERVVLYFAIDRQYQISRKLTIAQNNDKTEENVRLIRIQIDGQAGRSLKIVMFPRFDWILISEISFSSRLINSTDDCHYLKNDDSYHSEFISFHVLIIVSSILGSMCIFVVALFVVKCLRFKTAKHGVCKSRTDSSTKKLSDGLPSNRKKVSRNSLFSWSACRCNAIELIEEEMKKNDAHGETLSYFGERMLPELPQIMDWSEFYDGTHKYTKPLVLDSGSKTPPSHSSPSPLRKFYPIILYHEESQSVSPKRSMILEQKSDKSTINSIPNLKDLPELINISAASSPMATNSLDRQTSEECKSLLDQTSSVISMSKYFLKSQESLVNLPRDKLICLKRIGEGIFGEICLCEMASHYPSSPRKRVILKLLRDENSRNIFIEEAKVLVHLRNRNIVRLVGVCFQEMPNCIATEYLYFGDLKTFLQQFSCITIKIEHPYGPMSRGIRYSTLLYFGHQISCGMAYLEGHNVLHRDLAARNCLVGRRGLIKISDFCMSRKLYNSTFYQIKGVAILPIRWMAWESVLLGIFSSKSDVWSFGVTLWEIMTLGKIQPYEKMSDEEVIENCQGVFLNQSHLSVRNLTLPTYLDRPASCSEHLYEVMLTCWKREVDARPNFPSLRNKLFKLYDLGLVMIDLETSSASWSAGCQLNECFSLASKKRYSSDTEFGEDSAVLKRINSVLLTTDDDDITDDHYEN